MKTLMHIKAKVMALAIITLVNAPASLADGPFAGALAAGNANFAPTDVYRLTCPSGTATVRARITNPDGNPADDITAQVIAPNGLVRSVIAEEGGVSRTATLTGGAGKYFVSIHKDSTLIASRYRIILDCHRANSAAIGGIQSVMVQNQ